LFDIQGHLILADITENQLYNVNMQDYPTGMYIVKVGNKNESYTKKIVKY
jgi:hypothetical protein